MESERVGKKNPFTFFSERHKKLKMAVRNDKVNRENNRAARGGILSKRERKI